MDLPVLYSVFSEMLIFSSDPHIRNILSSLSKGLSVLDFRYHPGENQIVTKDKAVTLTTNRVDNYKAFCELLPHSAKKAISSVPVPEQWKKLSSVQKTKLIEEYVDRIFEELLDDPSGLVREKENIATKIIMWTETSAISSDDIVFTQSRIEKISKLSFDTNEKGEVIPKLEKRTIPKTSKSFKKTNPLKTAIEKYVSVL